VTHGVNCNVNYNLACKVLRLENDKEAKTSNWSGATRFSILDGSPSDHVCLAMTDRVNAVSIKCAHLSRNYVSL